MSENVQNVRVSRKLHHKSQGKLESWTSTEKNPCEFGKNSKMPLPERFNIATKFRFCKDTTELYTKKILKKLQMYKFKKTPYNNYIYIYISRLYSRVTRRLIFQ